MKSVQILFISFISFALFASLRENIFWLTKTLSRKVAKTQRKQIAKSYDYHYN